MSQKPAIPAGPSGAGSPPPRRTALEAGHDAEKAAVEFLKQQGFRILQLNWRCRKGEIDIVAEEGETVVFVEVKSRRSTGHGTPAEAVGRTKQARIVNAAALFAVRKQLTERPLRFDVVEMLVDNQGNVRSITLWRGAFEPQGSYQAL